MRFQVRATILSFPDKKTLLEGLVKKRAILVGDEVKRRYGFRTPIFIDLRAPIYQDPVLLSQLGTCFSRVLERWSTQDSPQQVIGVPDTGIPLSTATSLASFQKGLKPFITLSVLRKYARPYPHQIVSHFLGEPDSTREATLIDDVIASGSSLRSTVARLSTADIPVGRILVCVDREQGGVEALADLGIPIFALFSLSEIGTFCQKRKLI